MDRVVIYLRDSVEDPDTGAPVEHLTFEKVTAVTVSDGVVVIRQAIEASSMFPLWNVCRISAQRYPS